MRPIFVLLGLALAGCAARPQAGSSSFVVEDAERFAAILASDPTPAAATLQARYLDPGTDGLRIFTPNRIVDAANLANVVGKATARYRKAVTLCLPAARALTDEAPALIARVGSIVRRTDGATVYAVFGALNSGGTAGANGLVLGLEVLCQRVETEAASKQVLREFIAHEMAHVYQYRAGARPPGDLLGQSMIEGFADFVMERAIDGPLTTGADRQAYGLANEKTLWREFIADVDAGKRDTDWLYRFKVARAGQPPDMGYWFGKRICEAYYARATDKKAAMQALLEMRDARAILDASGYGRDS